jgi:uncharacterized protein YdeI (YjbR/CyaY-like superfamily)
MILENYTREQFRDWLTNNHDTAKEVFIVIDRRKHSFLLKDYAMGKDIEEWNKETFSTHDRQCKEGNITYLEALEEALCYGWIDSTVRKYGNCQDLCLQRFSPREKNSHWTELNKARVEMLISQGLMTDAGLREYKKAKPFVIDKRILKALKKDHKAYENFLSMPQVYKRIRIDSIQSTKDNKIFSKRLIKFIEECKNNILCWKCEEKIKAFSLK